MKEYNREKRMWVTVEKAGSLKRPKLCRGNKPHQYFLSLPEYVKTLGEPTVEAIEEYYKSEERVHQYVQNEHALLKSMGVVINTYSGHSFKHFRCAVCGKKDYNLKDK